MLRVIPQHVAPMHQFENLTAMDSKLDPHVVSTAETCIEAQQPQKRITRAQAQLPKTIFTIPNTKFETPSLAKPLTKNPRPRSKKKIFPFLNLPVEIRIQIYNLALTQSYILIRTPSSGKAANLLLVNKLIHSESFSIFYDNNVFQVLISGLPSDTEAQLANVHYMRQCCLHLDINVYSKVGKLSKMVDKFVAEIWSGNLECLLCDVWESNLRRDWGISALEKLSWVRGVWMVEVVVNQVVEKLEKKEKGRKGKQGKKMKEKMEVTEVEEVKTIQDKWCQRLERAMMGRRREDGCYGRVDFGHVYQSDLVLGIDLVGEDLEKARREGGWVVKENDLYVLFGKC